MWTILADCTNLYARSKSSTGEGNRCLDPTHPQYKKHCHLNSWCDVSTGDIKMFIAHILIMGLMKKPDLEKYWNMRTKAKAPFFSQYMSRNRFQSILWNFHVNDDSHNPPPICLVTIHCLNCNLLLICYNVILSMHINLQKLCLSMKPVALSKDV